MWCRFYEDIPHGLTLHWNRDLKKPSIRIWKHSFRIYRKGESNKKWVLSKEKRGTGCCPGSQINEVYSWLEYSEHGGRLSSSCDSVWDVCFLAARSIPSPAAEIESIHCSVLRNIIPGRNRGRTCYRGAHRVIISLLYFSKSCLNVEKFFINLNVCVILEDLAALHIASSVCSEVV
jgi:hypothetical protein